jgi:hypothetical protein
MKFVRTLLCFLSLCQLAVAQPIDEKLLFPDPPKIDQSATKRFFPKRSFTKEVNGRTIFDIDNDGWDDLWLMMHQWPHGGGPLSDIVERPWEDFDKDGVSNYEEMLDRTDPWPPFVRPILSPEERAKRKAEAERNSNKAAAAAAASLSPMPAVSARSSNSSVLLPDADSDGLSDQLELATGTNPNSAAPYCQPMRMISSDPTGGVWNLSAATAPTFAPTLRFRCHPGVIHRWRYEAQRSNDLISWADIDMSPASRTGQPVPDALCSPAEWVSIRSPFTYGQSSRQFLRLTVCPPWPPSSIATATVTLASLKQHITDSTLDVIPPNTLSKLIFDAYLSSSASQWSRFSWTNQVDLSGVSWDDLRDCTLISPRHVIMATHFHRGAGSAVVFHDRSGVRLTRTITAVAAVPGGLNPDITVGLLDSDVPLKFYKVLPPRTDWATHLVGALTLATDYECKLLVKRISFIGQPYVSFDNSPAVDDFYDESLIVGDSGNPSFVLVRGEPILIETHTYGGGGAGPFFSTTTNFNAINQVMASLGGGYQLSTVNLNP